MRLYKRPVVTLELFPTVPALVPNRVGDYVRVLAWMIQFPQMLGAYIENVQPNATGPKRSSSFVVWLLAYPLSNLFLISVAIGVSLLWIAIGIYGAVGIVLGRTDITLTMLIVAGLFGQSLFLLISLCVIVWQWLSPGSGSVSAFILTIFSYAAIYAAAGFIFSTMLLSASPLASTAWLVGVASGIVAGAAVRIRLLTRPVLVERSVYRWIYGGVGVAAVAVAGMIIEGGGAVDGAPYALFYLYQAIFFACIALGMVVLRPDDWLLAVWRGESEPAPDGSWQIPHVTLLPYAPVREEVADQLRLNWEAGVCNAQKLAEASYQLPYLITSVRRAFAKSDASAVVKQAGFLVEEFADDDWLFALAPDTDKPFAQPVRTSSRSMRGLWGSSGSTTRRRAKHSIARAPLTLELSLDTAPRAALAGFWYLYMLYPEKAVAAFEQAGNSVARQEMLALAEALKILLLDDIESSQAPLSLPKQPPKAKHKAMWAALAQLQNASRCVWVLQRCFSQSNVYRISNIAILHLNNVIQDTTIPAFGQRFLRQVATAWRDDVQALAHQQMACIPQGRDSPPSIPNPFVFAGPLLQNAPVHREKILDQVYRAWTMGNLQPLLVYGQSLVGKTSLVRSAQREMERTLETVFVNLRRLSPKASSTQLLQAISNAVADLLALPAPPPEAWQQDEHFVFQSFISRACAMADPRGLVVILDEFDHIESIMRTPIRRDHILRFLWDLGQAEAQLGFVFITKSTPQQLHTQYNNPYSSGLTPVHVGHFSFEETETLLRRPAPDFFPYILDEAIIHVYDLTGGHPYLLQIIGHGLVESYNAQIAAGQPHDPVFDADDVNTVLATRSLLRRAEVYYEMVLQEIGEDDAECVKVLRALAATRAGTTDAEVQRIDPTGRCIQKLEQHTVIRQDTSSNCWHLSVEMLRQWL